MKQESDKSSVHWKRSLEAYFDIGYANNGLLNVAVVIEFWASRYDRAKRSGSGL